MPIPAHPTISPAFNVPNKFPDLPSLPSLSDEDNIALQKFYLDFLNVITRQFTTVTTAIDTKQDKT